MLKKLEEHLLTRYRKQGGLFVLLENDLKRLYELRKTTFRTDRIMLEVNMKIAKDAVDLQRKKFYRSGYIYSIVTNFRKLILTYTKAKHD